MTFPHSGPEKEGILEKDRKEFRGTVLSTRFTHGSLGPSRNMLYVSLAYLYQSYLLRFSKQSLGLQWKIGRRKGMVGVIFGVVSKKKLFHS